MTRVYARGFKEEPEANLVHRAVIDALRLTPGGTPEQVAKGIHVSLHPPNTGGDLLQIIFDETALPFIPLTRRQLSQYAILIGLERGAEELKVRIAHRDDSIIVTVNQYEDWRRWLEGSVNNLFLYYRQLPDSGH